ncbi:MAG TPA: YlzJ-like family protein [Clostridia bacterium]
MIYSIIPFEQIFYDSRSEMSYMEVTLQGERVVLLKNKDNTYTIDKLVSTNPKAYLRPEFMPGTLLMNIEVKKDNPNTVLEIKTDF